METEQGNKLIAEFMGGRFYAATKGHLEEDEYFFDVAPSLGLKQVAVSRMKYHTSWDWLMPVVEKIESLSIVGWCSEGHNKINLTTNISNVWEQVVEFIEWYNKVTVTSINYK